MEPAVKKTESNKLDCNIVRRRISGKKGKAREYLENKVTLNKITAYGRKGG